MLKALRMAEYRSYREVAAFHYLKEIGFDTAGDQLYPDLVFSLPEELFAVAPGKSSPVKVVGVGLISYYGWRNDPGNGEAIYQEYLSKIKLFAIWLFQQGYQIRVLFGDTTDMRPVQDFSEFIAREYKTGGQNMISVGKITNVRELFDQIAQTDIVVASRFHNVLCSLMLERPVISLGYHEKNANLMTEMGLAKYCQHIEEFTFERLVEQFECYTTEMNGAVGQMHDRNAQYRQSLDEQYRNVLLPVQNRNKI
jgi:polysaccharide pyruvyl transferase WcaK-like protein